VDWGHFGHLQIGRARRPLMAFVMVLSHSRQIFLRFFLDARMENFLRGHVAAFTAWGGVARVLLYDNLKSAVLERRGDAIRFHPGPPSFAGHYRFEPRPVALARGNEKGRVERAIGYVRLAFFAARNFADLDDLNAQSLPSRKRGPRRGAAVWPPTGVVRARRTAPCARCSPKRCPACCRCPTIPSRGSSASRSRSAKRPMCAST
jgi:transposase